MTREKDLDSDERKIMNEAIANLREVAKGRPAICIIGFDLLGGLKICSVSNVDQTSQVEMMMMLIDGFEPVPDNATLN